jgi:hypothetical protein
MRTILTRWAPLVWRTFTRMSASVNEPLQVAIRVGAVRASVTVKKSGLVHSGIEVCETLDLARVITLVSKHARLFRASRVSREF